MIPKLKNNEIIRLIYIILIFLFILFSIRFFSYNQHLNFKIIQRPKFNKEKLSDKWIVVTTISEPTEQCKKLSNLKGFRLLVVGDKKTPSNWKLDKATFLSVNDQEKLQFKSFYSTPLNSYTRKNIGYLYAILNGAEFIYDLILIDKIID